MYRSFKTEFAGRPLVIETGKMAGLANAKALERTLTILPVADTSISPVRETEKEI